MTAADEAYRIAERLVEEARESGAPSLSFDREDCHALDRLPEGIAGLNGLMELSLGGTQVRDLSPLRKLTGLTALWLSGTKVSDLSPLRELTGLALLWLDGTEVSDLGPLRGVDHARPSKRARSALDRRTVRRMVSSSSWRESTSPCA